MTAKIIYTICLLCGAFSRVLALEENSLCYTPDKDIGYCEKVKTCEVITQAISTKLKEAFDFARKSQCGYTDQPLVCCGTTGFPRINVFQHRLLPPPTVCGLDSTAFNAHGFVYGGIVASLTDFPWMALLKYLEKGQERFRCGGTLIHERYVLTAAHCTKLPPNGNRKLIGVRLGEHNTSTSVDCTETGGYLKCSEPVMDVGIERVINYPNYSRRLGVNDIALIRLERSVQFTDFIRPICLPAEDSILPVHTKLTLAGWGETEISAFSDVKMKVQLPVTSPTDCGVKFGREINDYQFCAGGVASMDSCQGDSGGPLMREGSKMYRQQWIQEGIVSFGSADCGIVGNPAVYTQVSKYLEWIVNNL